MPYCSPNSLLISLISFLLQSSNLIQLLCCFVIELSHNSHYLALVLLIRVRTDFDFEFKHPDDQSKRVVVAVVLVVIVASYLVGLAQLPIEEVIYRTQTLLLC